MGKGGEVQWRIQGGGQPPPLLVRIFFSKSCLFPCKRHIDHCVYLR